MKRPRPMRSKFPGAHILLSSLAKDGITRLRLCRANRLAIRSDLDANIPLNSRLPRQRRISNRCVGYHLGQDFSGILRLCIRR